MRGRLAWTLGVEPMSDHDDKRQALRAVLENLTAREKAVLRKRFGIDVTEASSLDEAARNFETTIQRIREVERRALERLGKPDPGPDDAA